MSTTFNQALCECGGSAEENKLWEDSKKCQWDGSSAVPDSTAQLDTNTDRIDSVLTQSTVHACNALECWFVNARGLIGKIAILKTHVYEMRIDIMGVAETFLNDDDSVMQAEISIEGYTMI